ncbi:MAG: carboxylating nicotinate-nucleotide diphosphorylase [Thermogutta sp.]
MIRRDFDQITWTQQIAEDVRRLVRLAKEEDLGERGDITSQCTVTESAVGKAFVVSRRPGILAGVQIVDIVLKELAANVQWTGQISDGTAIQKGDVIGQLKGRVRDILCAERLILNFLGRLSGIATLTKQYVEAIQGTEARIYDTRKTTPGWRRLEKYAVRCGGGWNHRLGLDRAILIKDNHLAWLAKELGCSPAEAAKMAVRRARAYLMTQLSQTPGDGFDAILEIEVDSLLQLQEVLGESPDIVLLDNMSVAELREAVGLRNRIAPRVELEASGGITLENVRHIAETGVDRISVGALTHAARWLDIALDWETGSVTNCL